MTVIKSKRSETKFEVLVKAYQLAALTIHLCSNEKHFPKRYRWVITSKIVDESIDICRYIRKANRHLLDRDLPKEYTLRRKNQIKALGCIDSMLTLMDIAYYTFNIEEKTIENWTGKVVSLQTLLQNWKKSDEKFMKS